LDSPKKRQLAQLMYDDDKNSVPDICKALGVSRATFTDTSRPDQTRVDIKRKPVAQKSRVGGSQRQGIGAESYWGLASNSSRI